VVKNLFSPALQTAFKNAFSRCGAVALAVRLDERLIPVRNSRNMALIATVRRKAAASLSSERGAFELARQHSCPPETIGADELEAEEGPVLGSEEIAIKFAIGLVQGKWRIAILRQLQNGSIRLGDLKRRLSPISKKVLSEHLREMEKEGLIIRVDRSGKVPHVEFTLASPLGYAALTLLQSIAEWGGKHAVPEHASHSPFLGIGLF